MINVMAANNCSSISNAYDAAYLNIVGCDSYDDYLVDMKYWRSGTSIRIIKYLGILIRLLLKMFI
jgi:hypothetical protein